LRSLSSQIDEITRAVEEAVRAAEENAEGGADDRDSVKAAVQEVLAQYGVDAEAFNREMEADMPSVPPPPGGQNAGMGTARG